MNSVVTDAKVLTASDATASQAGAEMAEVCCAALGASVVIMLNFRLM
jgi:hypothetical protein